MSVKSKSQMMIILYRVYNSYFALQKVPMDLENSIIFDK